MRGTAQMEKFVVKPLLRCLHRTIRSLQTRVWIAQIVDLSNSCSHTINRPPRIITTGYVIETNLTSQRITVRGLGKSRTGTRQHSCIVYPRYLGIKGKKESVHEPSVAQVPELKPVSVTRGN